jgi:hypothetical protein
LELPCSLAFALEFEEHNHRRIDERQPVIEPCGAERTLHAELQRDAAVPFDKRGEPFLFVFFESRHSTILARQLAARL